VAQALLAGDARRMLDIVAELESNGRSLQHFARELARYFRNLLVAKVAGVGTRLIAAPSAEQERLARVSAQFSEEDLTRDLKLSLDLFRDLQSSLQPRLHLEMGLLRLVHAAKLAPIEEALAGLAPGPRAQAPTPPLPRAAAASPLPTQALGPSPLAPVSGDFRARLHATLIDNKQVHLADAVEHSEVAETPNEIVFTTSKMYQMFLKDPALDAAVKRVAGRAVRLTVKVGEVAAAPPVSAPRPKSNVDSEAAERALSHPEVKRFQELFPGQVRTVRNLKESES
jgi:DNA polymerase-3 subunit gamma/tau